MVRKEPPDATRPTTSSGSAPHTLMGSCGGNEKSEAPSVRTKVRCSDSELANCQSLESMLGLNFRSRGT